MEHDDRRPIYISTAGFMSVESCSYRNHGFRSRSKEVLVAPTAWQDSIRVALLDPVIFSFSFKMRLLSTYWGCVYLMGVSRPSMLLEKVLKNCQNYCNS